MKLTPVTKKNIRIIAQEETAFIVDIRSEQSFKQLHIHGSVNKPERYADGKEIINQAYKNKKETIIIVSYNPEKAREFIEANFANKEKEICYLNCDFGDCKKTKNANERKKRDKLRRKEAEKNAATSPKKVTQKIEPIQSKKRKKRKDPMQKKALADSKENFVSFQSDDQVMPDNDSHKKQKTKSSEEQSKENNTTKMPLRSTKNLSGRANSRHKTQKPIKTVGLPGPKEKLYSSQTMDTESLSSNYSTPQESPYNSDEEYYDAKEYYTNAAAKTTLLPNLGTKHPKTLMHRALSIIEETQENENSSGNKKINAYPTEITRSRNEPVTCDLNNDEIQRDPPMLEFELSSSLSHDMYTNPTMSESSTPSSIITNAGFPEETDKNATEHDENTICRSAAMNSIETLKKIKKELNSYVVSDYSIEISRKSLEK